MEKKRTKPSTVTLRNKDLKKGAKSLYLDIVHNGKRKKETLEYRLLAPTSKTNKDENKKIMALAEAVRAKRLLEIQNNTYGFTSDFKLDANFIEYFKSLVDQREKNSTKGTWSNWDSAYKHLVRFAGTSISFREVGKEFVLNFKSYLENEAVTKSNIKLAVNTQGSYFNKLKTALSLAYDEKIIPENPAHKVKGIKDEEVIKGFLYPDELKQLVKTPCKYPVIKNAFLFGCQTGLRFSDIEGLTWGKVSKHKDLYRIHLRQKKTTTLQFLDITEQTKTFLGDQGEPEERIFQGLKYSADLNRQLRLWFLNAGIIKELSFHCSRHTFACVQLIQGTDIYTVSKLLGHKNISTTQVYLKLIDEHREQAARVVPNILCDDQPTIEPDQIKCRFCGELMLVRFNFCGLCGGRLDTDNQLPKV